MSVKYRTLSKAVCDVLEAIWQLEVKLEPKARGATTEEIADKIGRKEGYVRQLIYEINQMSEEISKMIGIPIEYLATYENIEDEGPGRPHNTYLLNHDNLVTEPETALILLELQRTPKVKRYYVARSDFAKYLADELGFTDGSTNMRIDLAIGNAYINSDQETGFLRPSPRIRCEKRWLDRVVEEYEPPKATSVSRRKKTIGKKR